MVLKAAPWILLRGLTREAGHWGNFDTMMRRAVSPHAVHTPDLPGNGVLHAEKSPATVHAMMESVRLTLAVNGINPPYRLLGMSLGAMVCVAWAKAYPRELETCVLINTSMRPFSPLHHRLQPHNWPTVLRAALPFPKQSAVEAEVAVLRLTSNRAQPDKRQRLLANWVDIRDARPVSRMNALRQLWAAARFRAPDDPPGVPMLLLGSLGDRLVSPRCSESLARHWDVPLRQHADAGHDLPLDDAPWVLRRVQEWQAQLLGQSGTGSWQLQDAVKPQQ